MKKVLIYNWVDFEDAISRGGGVTGYIRNIFSEIKPAEFEEMEFFFLSSGTVYNFKNKIYIKEKRNTEYPQIKSFQIINSPIIAPANAQFSELDKYLNDEIQLEILEKFFVENGGFDIIHIQNMEGLSINALKLKEKFPKTKFIISLHNYYLFCPQVNLWMNNSVNCFKKSGFPNCKNCFPHPKAKIEKLNARVKYYLGDDKNSREGALFKVLKFIADKVRVKTTKGKSKETNRSLYMDFRNKNVEYVNKYCDTIIVVSEQVKKIAVSMGLDEDKIMVEYIGTSAVERYKHLKCTSKKDFDKPVKIAYFGYAREDKGYGFLLNSLLAVENDIASEIELFLLAKKDKALDNGTKMFYENIEKQLLTKYKKVTIEDGYTKNRQEQLLKQINLGIIPSLWEDNLPQVAIEFVAAGIPIITSNCGGAQELCGNKKYVFAPESADDFRKALGHFLSTKGSDWIDGIRLKSMREHIEELKKIYNI